MILGNSFGKNKGKKYFMRGKHDQNPDILYAEMAEEFNTWFGQNYSNMVMALKEKYIFDDDTTNDTYIKIYENILFCGIKIECYRSYFFRSYYTNYINSSMRNSRFIELTPNYDKLDNNSEDIIELEAKQKKLEADIFNYIYANYNIRDFELFKMYMSLKPAINYVSLSNITGLKTHKIQNTICKIKKDIRRNREFEKRCKEVL